MVREQDSGRGGGWVMDGLLSFGGSGSGWHGRCGLSHCPPRCPSPGRSVHIPIVLKLQGQGLLLPPGQLGQGLLEQAPGFLVEDGGDLGLLHAQGWVLQVPSGPSRLSCSLATRSRIVQGLPGGDGDEPGAEGGLKAEAGQSAIDADEGFLDRVIRVLVVLQDGKGLAVDIPGKEPDQGAEGGLVALLGLSPPRPAPRVYGTASLDRGSDRRSGRPSASSGARSRRLPPSC